MGEEAPEEKGPQEEQERQIQLPGGLKNLHRRRQGQDAAAIRLQGRPQELPDAEAQEAGPQILQEEAPDAGQSAEKPLNRERLKIGDGGEAGVLKIADPASAIINLVPPAGAQEPGAAQL